MDKLFDDLINSTVYMNYKFKINFLIANICKFMNYYIKKNKIKRVIVIGDSPVIFAKINKLFWDETKDFKDIELLYMEVSNLRSCIGCNKKLRDELQEKIPLDKKILWIDFLASGSSFLYLYNSMSKKLTDKSLFFLYGYSLLENSAIDKLLSKLYKDNKLYYFTVNNSIEETFLGDIIGQSEYYKIRCIKYNDFTKTKKIKLTKKLPQLDTYCDKLSKYFYKKFKNNKGMYRII